MVPCSDSEKLGLYANSKKIKKLSQAQFKEYSSSPEYDDVVTKRYRTYTKSQKIAIVADLKKTFEGHFEGKPYSTAELIDHLDSLNKTEYNEIIEKILAVHAPGSLKGKKNKAKWLRDLKQWRRQMKTWLRSAARPEKRGSIRVVSAEKTDEFKQKITAILKTMTTRSFDLLRTQAIDVLEDLHNARNPDQPFNRNTFSKHFWYDFKRAHPDIEELYESIPIARSNWRKGSRAETTISPQATTTNQDDFEEEFSDDFSELKTLSFCYQSLGSELDSFGEDNQSNWPDFCSVEQTHTVKTTLFSKVPIEEKKEEAASELPILDLDIRDEEDKTPKYDFYTYSERKMIVETEDNQMQRKLFRGFYYNGI